MSGRVELRLPGAERGLLVTEGSADYWRSLGYRDVTAPAPQDKPKAAPRKRATKKK